MSVTRRDVLRILSAGGLVLGAPSVLSRFSEAADPKGPMAPEKIDASELTGLEGKPAPKPAGPPDLAVIEGADPAANTKAAVDMMGGMRRFVSKGDKVVIKPNMGFGNPPEEATTTEPRVVRALAEMALEAGAKRVMIFDNPCHRADIAVEVCGMKKALQGLDDTFVFTIRSSRFFREVSIPKGKVLKKTKIAVDILEADTIINAPVAKSHGSAYVSFGMKNWMGAVEERTAWHTLIDLHEAIADIATFIRPKLTVLDATRVLVSGGPGGPGPIKNLKKIVAGTDPLAVDIYGLTLAKWGGSGYRVQDIPHFQHAILRQVGDHRIERMDIRKVAV